MNDELLNAALRYVACDGWKVFFLGRKKRPVANCDACRDAGPDHNREACDCLTCHGFYAATSDPDRVKAIRAAVPDGLLAVRTGACSGIVIVDIDPRHGGQAGDMMPRTAYVPTGSGGWHLYYTHPGTPVPCSQSRLGPGIDVRADGGYAVLPPSVHPDTGRPYGWMVGRTSEMPRGLIEACLPPAAPVIEASGFTPNFTSGGGISSPKALLDSLIAAVQRAPEGRRRTTLYGSARGVARMVAAGALTASEGFQALYEVGRAAGQTERETRTAITGGFRDEGVSA